MALQESPGQDAPEDQGAVGAATRPDVSAIVHELERRSDVRIAAWGRERRDTFRASCERARSKVAGEVRQEAETARWEAESARRKSAGLPALLEAAPTTDVPLMRLGPSPSRSPRPIAEPSRAAKKPPRPLRGGIANAAQLLWDKGECGASCRDIEKKHGGRTKANVIAMDLRRRGLQVEPHDVGNNRGYRFTTSTLSGPNPLAKP